jgi:hypothetical protein
MRVSSLLASAAGAWSGLGRFPKLEPMALRPGMCRRHKKKGRPGFCLPERLKLGQLRLAVLCTTANFAARGWMQQLNQGVTSEQVQASFASSGEIGRIDDPACFRRLAWTAFMRRRMLSIS